MVLRPSLILRRDGSTEDIWASMRDNRWRFDRRPNAVGKIAIACVVVWPNRRTLGVGETRLAVSDQRTEQSFPAEHSRSLAALALSTSRPQLYSLDSMRLCEWITIKNFISSLASMALMACQSQPYLPHVGVDSACIRTIPELKGPTSKRRPKPCHPRCSMLVGIRGAALLFDDVLLIDMFTRRYSV